MKHTITINSKNNTQHITYLDQHITLQIKKLPPQTAYQIQDTPILITTTKTLQQTKIQTIRQKNKKITKKTEIIIIKNTKYIPTIQIETIKENPQITINTTTEKTLHKTLNEIKEKLTPPENKKITTKNKTLYHDNKPIKTYQNTEYLNIIKKILKNKTELTLQEATITASIYYGYESSLAKDETINKGKVVFKVNGKTLKDANGKIIYAKVVNGTATIESYIIPDSWNKEGLTISAVYSGSSECKALRSEATEINITEEVTPSITTEDITTTAGGNITLTATITSSTPINKAKVVFKINGKTVKDTNGKVIYATVTNNMASIEYTLPETYKTRTYNITATLIASGYDRLTDTKTLTITA